MAPAALQTGAIFYVMFLLLLPAFAGPEDPETILRHIFPGAASMETKNVWLDEEARRRVLDKSRLPFDAGRVPYIEVRSKDGPLGFGFVDEVKGQHEMITYLAAVGADGSVRDIEILEYRESYGGEIRTERFRKQFVGKTRADRLEVGADIRNIAGATISTNAIAAGVRKILALVQEIDRPAAPAPREETARRARILWGTTLTIEIVSETGVDGERLMEDAFADVESLTPIFSRYDTSSEISRINANPGQWFVLSDPMKELLDLSDSMYRATHGMFNHAMRRPGRYYSEWTELDHFEMNEALEGGARAKIRLDTNATLDLDGIAKGYAVDRIVGRLLRRGVKRALVNFGESSIAAFGNPPGQAGWKISVRDARHPRQVTDTPLTTLVLRDAVLSVSGSYERGSHIINPFTGKPPPDSLETLVVGKLSLFAAAKADALSTALFAGGKKHLRNIEESGFEGFWMDSQDIVRTNHFSAYETGP